MITSITVFVLFSVVSMFSLDIGGLLGVDALITRVVFPMFLEFVIFYVHYFFPFLVLERLISKNFMGHKKIVTNKEYSSVSWKMKM